MPSWAGGILYAPNVHQCGGKTLLLPILKALKDERNVLLILDERLRLPDELVLSGRIIRVQPTMISRLLLEFRLWKLTTVETKILCMGSLPPLWARSENITVFVQNRYLLEYVPLKGLSQWVQFRIKLERWWLRTRAFRVQKFVVQTSVMRNLLNKLLWRHANVLPYYSSSSDMNDSFSSEIECDFLYVASGELHKNHRNLILAWVKLSEDGRYPSLWLTLDRNRDPDLCAWIDVQCQEFGLKVKILGELSHREIMRLYHASRALIYPSSFESFGLPLLEAALVKLPIAAADADYVREMVIPSVTFDPNSPESIAECIMKFENKPAKIVVKLVDIDKFISYVI